jgi:hypothetical protein
MFCSLQLTSRFIITYHLSHLTQSNIFQKNLASFHIQHKETIIIYRPGVRGIRRNITRSDDIPEGLCPEGNINTEGNISPNPLSGRSINDILYRKLKASKLSIKKLTHTFMNPMFYFRINASIVAFLSNHISFGILMTTFFKICFKILKKPQLLHNLPGLFITHQYYLYFVSHVVIIRVVSRGLCE